MRNTQALKDLVFRWNKENIPSKELPHEYIPLCRDLLYEDEELVRDVTSLMRRNIEQWAMKFSPIYSGFEGRISRGELKDKSRWYVDSMMDETRPMATSGSTDGRPFEYVRWDPFLYSIEGDNHYDLIMDEFGMPERPKVMYFFNTSMYDPSLDVTVRDDSGNFMEHHGAKRRAEVHYPNFARFQDQRGGYLKRLLFHLRANPVDVVFAPGPILNAICHEMKKVYARPYRVFGLVSNSNERLLPSDASFLLLGYAGAVCDHMRCWDGGASFWTCRHGTYHLMDNLSWAEEVDGMLVCTDYFSLPAPFVRYWNGDFCRIADTYQRCECGRLYREFEFLENRPFSLKGRSILEIRETISMLGLKEVKRVSCSPDAVVVTSFREIPDHKKKAITSRHHIRFKFVVER
jgi:hypothetical protein